MITDIKPTSGVDNIRPSMGIKTKLSIIISYLLWTYNETTLTYNETGYTYDGMIVKNYDIITPSSQVQNIIPKLRIK